MFIKSRGRAVIFVFQTFRNSKPVPPDAKWVTYDVPKDSIRLVVGTGGRFVKRMQEEPGVFNVIVGGFKLRVLCTKEGFDKIDPIIRKKIVQGVQSAFEEKAPYHQSVVVPRERVGHVVGKGGSFLKALEKEEGIMLVRLSEDV